MSSSGPPIADFLREHQNPPPQQSCAAASETHPPVHAAAGDRASTSIPRADVGADRELLESGLSSVSHLHVHRHHSQVSITNHRIMITVISAVM